MENLRRRKFSRSVWVPLRSIQTIIEQGEPNRPDYIEELFFAGSVAFPAKHREEAERLRWSDIGTIHSPAPYAFEDAYKPADIYQFHDKVDLGVSFIFEQQVGAGHENVWHVNPDLIMALNLIQEGDCWVRPHEGYVKVMQQVRNSDGKVVRIDIRTEFLADYLAARRLHLRLACYRQRTAIFSDASHIQWPEGRLNSEAPEETFEAGVYEIGEDGGPHGAGVALFHSWRTDVDIDDDVPIFGAEDEQNTAARSSSYTRQGPKFFRVEGRVWTQEWVEPSERSERVRGDEPTDVAYYAIDAAGRRVAGSALNSEEIGQYLWFEPRVINALLSRRGSGIDWYTEDTGSVWCSPDYKTHFGINRIGLINIYAYDIAKLPMWQQRIWSGFNVAPDGAVSAELLQSQMRAQPARTRAPEKDLPLVMDELDQAVARWLGGPLFSKHKATGEVVKNIHRFRSTDLDGLLSLAKDVARITADLIDVTSLHKTVTPPKGEKWGSLRSLEGALSLIIPPDQARSHLTVLVGVYELRLGDAHLPSSRTAEALQMVGIDATTNFVEQGKELLNATTSSLRRICETISSLTDN